MGTSFAGTIESVNGSSSLFKPGEKIATIRPPKEIGNPDFGAFQRYGLATIAASSLIPPSVTLHAASATILNLATVVSALSIHLKLARPPLTGDPTHQGKKVLIYGGSSSCGGLAIKYAVSAGYTVVTTSSPKNKDFVSFLGPAHIIDHTLTAGEIVAELQAQGPYNAIFDTIGVATVTDIMSEYLSSIGGGEYNTLIPPMGNKPLPANVERKFAPYNWAFAEEQNKEISKWLFEDYLPRGLESGLIVPTRQHVVGGGLGRVQEVLDLMLAGGVSGHKLVMNPWLD